MTEFRGPATKAGRDYLDSIAPITTMTTGAANDAEWAAREKHAKRILAIETEAKREATGAKFPVERIARWLHAEANRGRDWDDRMYGEDVLPGIKEFYMKRAAAFLAALLRETP